MSDIACEELNVYKSLSEIMKNNSDTCMKYGDYFIREAYVYLMGTIEMGNADSSTGIRSPGLAIRPDYAPTKQEFEKGLYFLYQGHQKGKYTPASGIMRFYRDIEDIVGIDIVRKLAEPEAARIGFDRVK